MCRKVYQSVTTTNFGKHRDNRKSFILKSLSVIKINILRPALLFQQLSYIARLYGLAIQLIVFIAEITQHQNSL